MSKTILNQTTESVSVSLPTWLLEVLDEMCAQHDFTRSSFIKRATRKYILSKSDNPNLWEKIYRMKVEE